MSYSMQFVNASQNSVNSLSTAFSKHENLGKNIAQGLISKFQQRHPNKTISRKP